MTRRLFRVGAAFMVLAVCVVVGAWVRGTSPAELVEICRAAVCAKTGKATVAERVAAIAEKRSDLKSVAGAAGGDIMIHGGSATVGCIPVGDDAVEEVFYIASAVGTENISVVIAPYDMRNGRKPELERSPIKWYPDLCREIETALGGSDVNGGPLFYDK